MRKASIFLPIAKTDRILTISILSVILGFFAGYTTALLSSDADIPHTASGISSFFDFSISSKPEFFETLFHSISGNYAFLGILCAALLITPVFPAAFIVLLYKGFCIGITCTILMQSCGLAGIITALAVIYPASLFSLTSLVVITVQALSVLSRLSKERYRKNAFTGLRSNANELISIIFSSCVLTFLACVCESVSVTAASSFI